MRGRGACPTQHWGCEECSGTCIGRPGPASRHGGAQGTTFDQQHRGLLSPVHSADGAFIQAEGCPSCQTKYQVPYAAPASPRTAARTAVGYRSRLAINRRRLSANPRWAHPTPQPVFAVKHNQNETSHSYGTLRGRQRSAQTRGDLGSPRRHQ